MQKTGDAMTDRELLRHYADTGSQDAFAELVRRHIDWVYAVCRRRVGDPALAEDVTQAVFIVLARKAPQLSRDTVMTGWLMTTAKFASADALKARRRREHHEAAAAKQRAEHDALSAPASSDALLSDLDDAMLKLSDTDRSAIVLRYYKNLSVIEVAQSLGISEDAAKKRLTRSLDRLRKFMSSGAGRATLGVAVSLPVLLASTAAQAAPTGLTQTTIAAAVTGKAGAALAIAKGAASMMAWSKAKATALVALIIAIFGATTATVIVSTMPARATPSTTNTTTIISPPTQPAIPLDTVTIDADPGFHRVITKRRLRFADAGGAAAQFQLVMHIWGTPDNSVTLTDVVVEHDGDKSAMLIRTMDGRPYLIASAGWAVRLNDRGRDQVAGGTSSASVPDLLLTEGVWPDVALKTIEGAPRDGMVMDWHAKLDRSHSHVNIDLASIIEAIQINPVNRSYNADTGVMKLQSPAGGGSLTLPKTITNAPDAPPITQFTFSEYQRLGIGIDKLRIGRATKFAFTALSLQSMTNSGLSVRRVTPEEFGASVFPPARFWALPAHRAASAKLAAAMVDGNDASAKPPSPPRSETRPSNRQSPVSP